ncbi:cysteine desulfurase DndA [Bacillus cereus]|uniref:cysteine desulfurase DndA n=1 Tax=Bacillus cereus TaxID=1396 RepID=UPI000BF4165F|nr:cysteine desulfurase DndA [Bacillus cereus]PEQ46985.1 cysteine desulfurase DndA [Bacillus cereus]PFM97288.1 cysteine desulfurase DndA [Bacillus cereus]
MLYLDNSATTQLLPEVKEAMLPYLLEEFGNPSSKYYGLAQNAKEAVETARKHIAQLLGCETDEVIFTSGATESNNFILKGITHYHKDKGNHIITSKVEHPSIIETCKFLEENGYTVTYLDVDQYGRINLEELTKAIQQEKTLLVSIMWGNNELGSLNQINEIAKICKENEVFFHTDATQVVGKIQFSLSDIDGINFLSCSSHKFHGPKGIGVTIIGKDNLGLPIQITPLLHGGGQERDIRSGTLPVHNIVGMGKAAEIAYLNLEQNIYKLEQLENKLADILKTKFQNHIDFNNDIQDKIPGILSVIFKGVNNETLVRTLSPVAAVSTGSACSSSKPSHVLQAIGLSMDDLRSTIRFSLSSTTSLEELDVFNNL